MAYRFHIVQEFNKGIYDYIIATDESGGKVEVDSGDEKDGEMGWDAAPAEQCERRVVALLALLLASNHASLGIVAATQRTSDLTDPDVRLPVQPASRKRKRESSPRAQTEPASTKKRKKRARGAKDREYGVSRGIDFVDVACVINFDLPTSAKSYTHRVGRTARAGRSGIALSLIVPREEHGKNRVLSLPGAVRDEKVFSRVEKEQAARGAKIEEWKFEKGQVEGFRYRMEDALRAVTTSTIKEARIKELKQEILASNKLKVRFLHCSQVVFTLAGLRTGPLRGPPDGFGILAPRQTPASSACPTPHEVRSTISIAEKCGSAGRGQRRCREYWFCAVQGGSTARNC